MSRAKELNEKINEKEPPGVKKRIDKAVEMLMQAKDVAVAGPVQNQIDQVIKDLRSMRV